MDALRARFCAHLEDTSLQIYNNPQLLFEQVLNSSTAHTLRRQLLQFFHIILR